MLKASLYMNILGVQDIGKSINRTDGLGLVEQLTKLRYDLSADT